MAKTAEGLVEYCRAQLGRPYWWGTFGQTATAGLYSRKKEQYPAYYTARDYLEQLGVKVHDCAGLIKGYLWCATPESEPVYRASQDVNVRGLFALCGERGALAAMPEQPGVCVFGAALGHVGVYVGDGRVIAAEGHARGVTELALRGGEWSLWGKPAWFDYASPSAPERPPESGGVIPPAKLPGAEVSVTLSLLRLGARGEQVRTLQRLLIAAGHSCGPMGADGDFGSGTRGAVQSFQRRCALAVDGEVGAATWNRLLKG